MFGTTPELPDSSQIAETSLLLPPTSTDDENTGPSAVDGAALRRNKADGE
jgi:hypothetical protein